MVAGLVFLLLQDFQPVVLGAQPVSLALGGLQLGIQLSFNLHGDTEALPVQQSGSPGLQMLQVLVQGVGILGLSHRQT